MTSKRTRTPLRFLFSFLALAVLPVQAEPLRLALTNDDGWRSPGIQALASAFQAHGFQTTLVAPLNQQSGSSAALNTNKVTVTRQAERTYSAAISPTEGAEPLVAGMLAIDIATALDGMPPDLLVSGINQGANLGSASQHSGTVGAVIGALNPSINGALGGIAVSTDEPKCDAACITRHYADVAEFTANLLAALPTPLPAGVGLNINYPPLPKSAIRGVKVVRQGHTFPLGGRAMRLDFRCDACATLADGESAEAGMRPAPDASLPEDSGDNAAFADGYITIVPIEGDYTADNFARLSRQLGKAIRKLP
ncbi:MAG: 5'/3'-nucleotidase SurE [Pseudomonadales bacterium]